MKRSFWSLILTQVQVLLNDNAAKLMLITLGAAVAPELVMPDNPVINHLQVMMHNQQLSVEENAEAFAKEIKSILATIILLPFVLFAPMAGWISDRFSKRDVIIWTLWAQIGIMAILGCAIFFHILALAVLGLFLLGLQCAIFSPAKQGIIKEIVTATKISAAVGIVEVTAIASMLLGGLAGGMLYDFWGTQLHSPWKAGLATISVLTGLAFLSLIAGYQIKRTPAHSNQPFRLELFWEHFVQLKEICREGPIRFSIFGITYFYGLAGVLYLTLFEVAHSVYGNGPGTASHTGIYASTLGFGIICGSVLVTRLTTHQVEVGLIPLGSAGLIAGLLAAGLTDPNGWGFLIALFGMGLAGALFVVPLNAYLQERVEPGRRGRVLSANNLFVNLFGIVAVIMQYLITQFFHITPQHQLVVYAIPTAILTGYIIFVTPEGLLRLALGLIGRSLYRVRPIGLENLPATGGVLLLPNHISFVDAIILQLACPRNIRFLVYEQIYRARLLNWGLKLLGSIPINPKRARSAIDAAAEALAHGEVVCLFPEGALTRTATLQKLNRGYELIARKARVPVMPVWLENVWGSVFSYYSGLFFWKIPRAFPLRVWIYFGEARPADKMPPDEMRRALYDLSEQAFQNRSELKSHVGREAIRGLQKKFFNPIITDAYAGGRTLTGGKLLGVSLALSRWIKKNVPEKRVGLVLPAGLGATIANLACVLAGKTPVNLNFTAGRAANESAWQQAGLKTLISHPAMVEKAKDFPWPKEWHNITDLLGGLNKKRILFWLSAAYVTPVPILGRWLGLPAVGDQAEASLLFTSGSVGAPKGVILTHRNILANTAQIAAVLARTKIESILGCLPIFHSFGATVTFWWPMLGGPQIISYPNPLDAVKLAELIEEYQIDLMLNTPTFLRAILRRAKPEQLKSLKFVVTGAEKLPLDLLREFEEKFGVTICEGYGMTEATPVVAVNLPDVAPSPINPEGILGRKIGSVGRLMPGLSPRIRHPETGAELSLYETGLIWLRGGNIFTGYLNEPKRTEQVLQDGWYNTGDLGRMDEEGFLYVEGRISRFSKIAGEMVPHGTIEAKITEVFGGDLEGEALAHLVIGFPDPERGESLHLLTTQSIEGSDLRRRLSEAGLPNLWIPKQIHRVASIPILATGKLDLRACQNLAQNLIEGAKL